jgi:hypothetical protein
MEHRVRKPQFGSLQLDLWQNKILETTKFLKHSVHCCGKFDEINYVLGNA